MVTLPGKELVVYSCLQVKLKLLIPKCYLKQSFNYFVSNCRIRYEQKADRRSGVRAEKLMLKSLEMKLGLISGLRTGISLDILETYARTECKSTQTPLFLIKARMKAEISF